MKKSLRFIFIGIILAPLLLVFYSNFSIVQFTKDLTFNDINQVSKNKVGLLLGTSKTLKDGRTNLFFKYRVDAAVQLFNTGKIDFILVSGDNRHRSYNEPRDLRTALISEGIPSDKIVLDYAGFRTLDSVIRSNKVFGQSSITVISQKFHNQRAIYLARKNGIDAIGYNAKDPDGGHKVYWREYLAKTKAFLDILTRKQPKFLGEAISIE